VQLCLFAHDCLVERSTDQCVVCLVVAPRALRSDFWIEGWGGAKIASLLTRNTLSQIHFRNLTIPCLWPRPSLSFKKSGEAPMRVATGIALIIAASATMAQGQSLQEQATCAQQAKAAFQDYKEGAPPGFSGYQSHYNKELNKCFILINHCAVFILKIRASCTS
jgi:hypothetical protein